ncbi:MULTISPECIES: polysaccharide biosynthesis/export family protein [Microvirga]|uniref:polysaccharide biosynthesis/export family protein n=1 Tax=Microvirga TaxID=186650 RepID=UPI001CFE8B38|nr:polysaccharide biosynthesis/export family protein [Microvirga lenta]MCB5173887.1 polysaccharide biosynthesis/export family protein [Microvirga lenta]
MRQLILMAIMLALFIPRTALADYLVAPGDTLEISIASLPEFRQRTQVNMEGQITYPLVGSIGVAGLSLSDIQTKLKNELANKSVRSRSSDGTERIVYVYPEEVSVVIAEYRPVYVNGDVSKPGELPYRPRMTVRQAIALAGGLDTLRFRTRDPNLEEVDLRTESNLLREELMRQEVLVARLAAELKGEPEFQVRDEEAAAQPISRNERAQAEELKLALIDHDREIKSLGRSLEQTQAQAATLGRLQEQLTKSYEQQAEEVARLRSSFERGLASVARIAEEQRALAFASERLLQTEAQLSLVKKDEEEQRRQLQKAEDQRRLKLMRDLQEAETKLHDLKAKIRAADEKILYVGSLRSRLASDSLGRPRVQIFRNSKQAWEGREVDEDTELVPGDVVEVTLRQAPAMRALP